MYGITRSTLPHHFLALSTLLSWMCVSLSSQTCPSIGPWYAAQTCSVQARGATEAAAYYDLIFGDGMEDDLKEHVGVVCGPCTGGEECAYAVNINGSVSGIHYVDILGPGGAVIGKLCIGIFTGSCQVNCSSC